jgi:hypothetical protein
MQGVSLTPEELYASMSRRREAVRQGQEIEALEAANRARQAMTATVPAGVPATAVYRSVTTASVPAPKASEISVDRSRASSSVVRAKKELSAISSEVKETEEVQSRKPVIHANIIYTSCRIEEIVDRLTRAALSIDQSSTSKSLPQEEGFSKGLRISICRPADKIQFDGEVIEVPSIPVELELRVLDDDKHGAHLQKGVVTVEAVRLSGDIFSFQYILKALKNYVISHEDEPLVSSELDLVEDFGVIAQGLLAKLAVK